MSEIMIWWLRTWRQNPCWQSQRSDVSCSWPPGLHTSQEDFVPLFADPLQVINVSRLTFDNANLQLPPQMFCRIKVWRFARPLQDLNVLLIEPLLCCIVFWVIIMLEYPSMTHFQCPGPDGTWPTSIVPLMRCSCPVPLAEKHPQNMFPPTYLAVGMCSWGHRQHSFSSKYGELNWCQKAGFWSHLNTFTQFSSESFRCSCKLTYNFFELRFSGLFCFYSLTVQINLPLKW